MTTIKLKDLPSKEGREEIGKKARKIYEALREKLEKQHWGDYIAINYENGDYIISTDHEEAARQMQEKYSGLIPFVIRIGYRAVYHFGTSGLSDGKRP